MSTLFSVGGGGHGGLYYLKEVEEYSLLKNKWKFHSQLPRTIGNSAAVVLKRVMYNFAG